MGLWIQHPAKIQRAQVQFTYSSLSAIPIPLLSPSILSLLWISGNIIKTHKLPKLDSILLPLTPSNLFPSHALPGHQTHASQGHLPISIFTHFLRIQTTLNIQHPSSDTIFPCMDVLVGGCTVWIKGSKKLSLLSG